MSNWELGNVTTKSSNKTTNSKYQGGSLLNDFQTEKVDELHFPCVKNVFN